MNPETMRACPLFFLKFCGMHRLQANTPAVEVSRVPTLTALPPGFPGVTMTAFHWGQHAGL